MILRLPHPCFSPPDAPGSAPAAPAAPAAPVSQPAAPSQSAAPSNADVTSAAALADNNGLPQLPDGLDPKYFDATSGLKTGELVKDYNELAAFKAEQDAKAALVPADETGYKAELPKEFLAQLPKEIKITYDEKDPVKGPVLKEVRAFAKANGFSQEQFSGALALEAKLEIAKRAAKANEVKAEHAKLGDKGPDRLSAIENVFNANLTKEQYDALAPVMQNANAVAGIEKIISLMTASNIPVPADPSNPNPTPAAEQAQPLYNKLFPNRVAPNAKVG